jgi:hypothetical protein
MPKKRGGDSLNEYRIFETENYTENIERLIKSGFSKIYD